MNEMDTFIIESNFTFKRYFSFELQLQLRFEAIRVGVNCGILRDIQAKIESARKLKVHSPFNSLARAKIQSTRAT